MNVKKKIRKMAYFFCAAYLSFIINTQKLKLNLTVVQFAVWAVI